MRLGKVAILITIAAAALRCSGNPPVSEPGQAVLNAPSAVVIHGVDHTATPSGTEVILHGNYPFSYTSYQPDPRTLVLELLDVQVTGLDKNVVIGTPQVEKVSVSSLESIDGGSIAKFEFRNVIASQHAIRLEGNNLVVDFPSLTGGNASPEPLLMAENDPSVIQPEEGDLSLPEGDEPVEMEADAGLEDADLEPLGPAPASNPAPVADAAAPAAGTTMAGELQPLPEGDSAVAARPVTSSAAARPAAAASPGAQPASAPASGPSPVQVVRGAAPSGKPAQTLLSVAARGNDSDPAVVLTADGAVKYEHFELKNPPRLVIDLIGVVDRTTTKSVKVDSQYLSRVRVAQFATRPQPVSRVVLDMSTPRAYAMVPTESGLVVDFSEEAVRHASESGPVAPAPIAQPLAAQTPKGQPGATPSAQEADAGMALSAIEEEPPAEDDSAEPIGASNPLLASGEVKIGQKTPGVGFKPASKKASDNIMISQGTGRFASRAITDTGPKYTGKRISLNFKDADLKDVFRLFHEITGYNIVLENVPEDQALDIILKNNGLDKVFENNVIRIATTQKLAAEASARKALLEAQQLEQEPITFTRSLSYAKAKDVTPIIKKVMSKRGDVVMDERTNTLIITDLLERQEPINRLIDALDEQTPQVVIEARIVETDREFERDFGVIWGVRGEATTAKGTQTKLQFPHTGTVNYDVALPSAATAGSLGLSFGNVLDSVTLDVQLDAFELNGDVKVLSSPRIATQNNQKATIEQGVQIPVVSTTATQINVEFISASLKLEVTPQITKEGTVIMDVRVDNSSPDFVNRVGDVPPIITERAQTQILVADGGTAVIGGIFKLNDSITQAGVPGLSKIPGLGWLFKSKSVNRKNTELLIFITPRISKKAEAQEVN